MTLVSSTSSWRAKILQFSSLFSSVFLVGMGTKSRINSYSGAQFFMRGSSIALHRKLQCEINCRSHCNWKVKRVLLHFPSSFISLDSRQTIQNFKKNMTWTITPPIWNEENTLHSSIFIFFLPVLSSVDRPLADSDIAWEIHPVPRIRMLSRQLSIAKCVHKFITECSWIGNEIGEFRENTKYTEQLFQCAIFYFHSRASFFIMIYSIFWNHIPTRESSGQNRRALEWSWRTRHGTARDADWENEFDFCSP